MIKLLILTLFCTSLFSNDKLFECTKIFEERKAELILELERIDEKRQTLDALKSASDELLERKKVKLTDQEARIEKQLASVSTKEANIQKILKENKKVLEAINTQKMNNIAQTFSKMKPAAAAGILSSMQTNAAVRILQVQKPKTVGKILTKMDPTKASELTLELTKEQK